MNKMNKEDWDEWEHLYKEFTKAREAYEDAQSHLRGSFSELARHYEQGTIDQSRRYQEQIAHDRFVEKRAELQTFMDKKLKGPDVKD